VGVDAVDQTAASPGTQKQANASRGFEAPAARRERNICLIDVGSREVHRAPCSISRCCPGVRSPAHRGFPTNPLRHLFIEGMRITKIRRPVKSSKACDYNGIRASCLPCPSSSRNAALSLGPQEKRMRSGIHGVLRLVVATKAGSSGSGWPRIGGRRAAPRAKAP
jgi:hypothetical protein